MNSDIDRLLAALPRDLDRVIVVYPDGDDMSALWYGFTPTQVAESLYTMADQVVDQRIPPPDWRERIK